jgi:hypothetical protein
LAPRGRGIAKQCSVRKRTHLHTRDALFHIVKYRASLFAGGRSLMRKQQRE